MAISPDNLIDSVMGNAVIAGLDIDENVKRKRLAALVDSVVGECMMRYPWSFATGVHSHPGGTTANEPLYTLSGSNKNARSIINIRYGDKLTMLHRYRPIDFDKAYSGIDLPDEVVAWVQEGTDSTFPRIRLIGTPDTSSNEIRYRYYLKGLTLANWPDECQFVIESGLMKRMVPSEAMNYQFNTDINTMIVRFEPEGTGGEISPAPIDPYLARLNRERNALHTM